MSVIGVMFLALWCAPAVGVAQDAVPIEETPVEQQLPLSAAAGKNQNVKVGQTAVFDGSASFNPLDTQLRYRWEFGDGTRAEGANVTHEYQDPGEYIVQLVVDNGETSASDTLLVVVEENIVILVTDDTIPREEVDALVARGKDRGVLLVSVTIPRAESTYLADEKLTDRLLLVQDDLAKSSIIVTWTNAGVGLQSLIGLEQRLSRSGDSSLDLSALGFPSKIIVDITDRAFGVNQRLGESVLDLVGVQGVILARKGIMNHVFLNPTSERFVRTLADAGTELRFLRTATSVNEWKFSNVLFRLENMLLAQGVPVKTLLLILFLPVIATIVALARAFFGVHAFGIFVPSIISLALITTGLRHGLAIFVVVLLVATVVRYVFRRLRFLYLARISLMLTIVSLSLVAMLVLGAEFGRLGFIAVPIFPVLVMVTLIEQFVAVQIDKGLGAATRITVETLLLAILGYFIANWGIFRSIAFGYPSFVFVAIIVITMLLGRFQGLRLGEYFRFRQTIRHADVPSKK